MAGRKNKYYTQVQPHLEYIDQQLNNGASEKQIAQVLGVAYSSWMAYKNQFEEFKRLCNKPRAMLVDNLRSKLVERALGMRVTTKKTYIKEDEKNGRTKYTEITETELPPDTTAIFGALNLYDKDYVRDKKAYELRQEELELKKELAKKELW